MKFKELKLLSLLGNLMEFIMMLFRLLLLISVTFTIHVNVTFIKKYTFTIHVNVTLIRRKFEDPV